MLWMENIENVGDECRNYLHTPYLLENQEYSWTIDGYYDSSSPDGAPSSAASKNIVSERNRRKQLNQRLFALRAVVPNITKMDKASIIKDAIDYIQQLQEELAKTQTEIMEMECNNPVTEEQPRPLPQLLGSHNTNVFNSASSPNIQLLQLNVTPMGDNILLVNLTCTKRAGTIVKLCQLFESFNLKIITANITALPGALLNTLFIEADVKEKDGLKMQIETAIAALMDPPSPMMT
ncbi:hypothetical protein like AT5G57150 [Hibiscus trionum]|uniref:BHLH domain-containing protein n=1 Tax=Hibiscus trionum TaxID=183268 RepID=A0A9W7LNK0_HIBTR|nr:hypothetical protein like AT5G57150 [Hibiscus trionum]